LLRRNILAYKAPPNNEGYDLICIHPDPKKSGEQVRVQVKSRYQTDCDRAFPVKAKSFEAFDYLIIVFLNNGYYYRKRPIRDGLVEPELFTLPAEFIREHHVTMESGWEKVLTKGQNMERYRNENGFELIASDLQIPYPGETAAGG